MSRGTIAELMEHTVPVRLLHLGMDIITRIPQLCNFLGQEFDAVHRVAKDDTLVNLQFRKQCIQTMNLLPLFHIRIKLRYTPQREFIHEINGIRLLHEFLTKRFDSNGEGGTKETNLMIGIT